MYALPRYVYVMRVRASITRRTPFRILIMINKADLRGFLSNDPLPENIWFLPTFLLKKKFKRLKAVGKFIALNDVVSYTLPKILENLSEYLIIFAHYHSNPLNPKPNH